MTKIRQRGVWNDAYQDVTSGLDFRSRATRRTSAHKFRAADRHTSSRTARSVVSEWHAKSREFELGTFGTGQEVTFEP